MKKIAKAKERMADIKVYIEQATKRLEKAIENGDKFTIGSSRLQIQFLESEYRELEALVNKA